MNFVSFDVNLFAVLVAAIVTMVIGGLWYSPLLFGKLWAQLMGFTQHDMEKAKEKGMSKAYVLQFITTLVLVFVLANLMTLLGIVAISEAFQLVFWIWLGFQVTLEFGTVLWGGKSWTLFLLNAAHNFVALLFAGWVLVLML